ncbi:DUF896 domain-containing protein [Fictibacillus phosphorivorans]|uniref:DUF896 domain-containing protein n=1 Tax=Fictibacillus phosphorivorans TaxID=1221500 RepID=UPI00203DDB36|nr:DUF896 domain-containing protein [Fictibacillus phosphorivorans]MCM3717057.1 DUF896 domain-containing protein [Fictibacillus phosphorivorans]MCM3774744.1 DUF896 domain-containing protein [Fictibacillus phosphorivorans]
MLSKDKLQRINELSRKSKQTELSNAEQLEQKKLREEYLQAFRKSFVQDLHGVTFVDPKGNDVTPEKLKRSKENKNNLKH